ncbi:MAG: hypothetical protein A3D67_02450 [Candidatus Lloydbacteria bacterium RIFCSPHIGHO2_02_FULL_51_22]|uniref:NTP pyrophosphohydrolase MazG-like domain-containing protein n=2 Tax=Candidatus Lloydiibacteriota TaxID=1817910 RepID=A0A1G2DGL5_9BACT|nr:MAG: hypothetical protein A3D67_02450 [Candidatus Lloydbacteria bacterium RIFCSPHIGHO2_02_FULL_51_22]OGZ14802.1 MAG: hypothetical protein A3J08_00485 [Candidatus Lloydbacteria bacterium RIFCSPLOWO2_02_FULL_51_11]
MKFDDYQKKAKVTALYPKIQKTFVYPVIGLAGEAGELLNKVKKIFRDDRGKITSTKKEEIAGELGDVLWYVAQIATEFHLSLKDVAQANIAKLKKRQKAGSLHGSGDAR